MIETAFALGWHMAELYRPELYHRSGRASTGDGLPGLGGLSSRQRRELGLAQAQAARARLRDTIEQAELTAPDLHAALHALDTDAPEDELRAAIAALHEQLLLVLTAADFRLGKAYGLGRALADTSQGPRSLEELRAELAPHRVATLSAWLSDLGSALPPHAAHVAHASLKEWSTWAAGRDAAADASTWKLLRRQGELWRALLSGEKRATDMLTTTNYLDAARKLLSHLGTLVRAFLRRFWALVGSILVLFAAGIVLMLARHGSGGIAAGAGAIVASLGLSWKGVGRGLGALLSKVERPLWDVELSAAVVEATCLVPDRASAANSHHRELALADA